VPFAAGTNAARRCVCYFFSVMLRASVKVEHPWNPQSTNESCPNAVPGLNGLGAAVIGSCMVWICPEQGTCPQQSIAASHPVSQYHCSSCATE
jgi:hypothetical protein